MKRDPLAPPPRFRGGNGCRPQGGAGRIPMGQDQDELLSGDMGSRECPDAMDTVPRRAAGGDLHRAPVLVGRTSQEEIGRTIARIFVIDNSRRPGLHGTGKAGFLRLLSAGLLPADQYLVCGQVPLIRSPPILPLCPARRASTRRHAAGRFPPRLALLYLVFSVPFRPQGPRQPASRFRAQRAQPSGGAEQTRATRARFSHTML